MSNLNLFGMDRNGKQEKFYKGRYINCETACVREGYKKSEPSNIAYFVIGKGCRLKKIVYRGEE